MIRIAARPLPPKSGQPYLEQFYGALAEYGIQLVQEIEVNDLALPALRAKADVLHFQWGPEELWRSRGKTTGARARGVVGLWRYLSRARRVGFRIVWTIHDFEHHEGSGTWDRLGYEVLAQTSDLVICHSQWCAGRFRRRHPLSRADVVVMPLGNCDGVYPPPRSRADVLSALSLDPGKRTLALLGLLRPYKGVDLALTAMARLGDYQLIVAGDALSDTYRRQLQSLAAAATNVRLIDRSVDDQTFADLTHAADCVLLPYRRITGSSALLNAATMSRGIVAADLPYFREVVAPEPDAAVLHAPGDPDAIAAAIRRFFSSSVNARHAAARRLADRYAWERVVEPVAHWILSQDTAQEVTA